MVLLLCLVLSEEFDAMNDLVSLFKRFKLNLENSLLELDVCMEVQPEFRRPFGEAGFVISGWGSSESEMLSLLLVLELDA